MWWPTLLDAENLGFWDSIYPAPPLGGVGGEGGDGGERNPENSKLVKNCGILWKCSIEELKLRLLTSPRVLYAVPRRISQCIMLNT